MTSMFGVNVSSYEDVIYGGREYVKLTTVSPYYGGTTFYVPKDYNENTKTVVCFNVEGYGSKALETSGANAIIAVPNSATFNDNNFNQFSHEWDTIKNNLGIHNNDLYGYGESLGGESAVKYPLANLKVNGPQIGPQTIVVGDPANDGQADAYRISQIPDDQVQLFRQSGSTLISFENKDFNNFERYERFGSENSKVAVFKLNDNNHGFVCHYGANNGVLAYMNGKKMSPVNENDLKSAHIFNSKTGHFDEVPVNMAMQYLDKDSIGGYINLVSNFDAGGEYHVGADFGNLTSRLSGLRNLSNLNDVTGDKEYIVGMMNEIRSCISSSNFLSSSINIDCSSTTSVPACAADFLYDYSSTVLTMLEKLVKETENALYIGDKIEETNTNLEKEVENLVASENVSLNDYVFSASVGAGMAGVISSTSPVVDEIKSEPVVMPSNSATAEGSKDTDAFQNPIVKEESTPVSGGVGNDNTSEATEEINGASEVSEPNNEANMTTETNGNLNEEIVLEPYDVDKLLNKNISEKLYNITADDLNRLFEKWAEQTGNYNSPLLGTGESWIKACEETGLDPLTLVGICGNETGRGGFGAMPYMSQKNFFGMEYVDPFGDGTGPDKKWGSTCDMFGGDTDAAVLACAKRIKNFYGGKYGGNSIAGLAAVGYARPANGDRAAYGVNVASIMKESLDYITSTNGGL